MPWEELVSLTGTLGGYLSDISLQTTRQIREVVLPAAVAYDLEPEDVIDLLVELGLAELEGLAARPDVSEEVRTAARELVVRKRSALQEDGGTMPRWEVPCRSSH